MHAEGVVATTAEEPMLRRIDLLPNCSLTPGGALFFFAGIAAVSLTVAGFFVLSGFWPVLPFAGLELGLLGWALASSLKRRHWTQTIEIDAARVVVETRGPRGTERHEYPRHWASVKLSSPPGWYPARLLLGSHGRMIEVGAFLTEEERRRLHDRLRALIGRTNESPGL
jgi:uncharacterized membrane protein